ncbi:heavy metal translocating P-type ATPase [Acuticoccus sp. MNP-M23]|uniref:heavy metal translocating P-type ATPase n=1 Tax=Acuticoccus sp. MNP-M23 TaxID=3072793 RepID=UPI0028169E8A|nr:heavy metal translocating P-type ATPase [Acuticoccus sp. MNP-M23]WMS44125.1 heavy metal translocating P-type ATPase [Acuticoccus sp. MNP-M23]
MSCCGDFRAQVAPSTGLSPEMDAAVRRTDGGYSLTLHAPQISCAACIGRIEDAVAAAGDGVGGRVNFTRRTLTLSWDGTSSPANAVAAVRELGYSLTPLDQPIRDEEGRTLIRALGVAGFAAMNVMLLSVSVWSGAADSTAAFFNWFSALIALPALAYAARPFVRSALRALRGGRLNMDVPIALAIVLAAGLSLARTVAGDGETYFDAAITLTFFLLAGRVLDHMMRERARASVRQLAAIAPATAHVFGADGSTVPMPLCDVRPGMVLEIAAGERIPVDGTLDAAAAVDLSLATGESRPVTIAAGAEILSGALALSGPLRLAATRPAADSFLTRLADLQRAAEETRSRPARIADRAARIYAPAVHLLAALTLAGWLVAGASPGFAVATAIAVLIITCPCALGLAVPAVQVAASDRLFRRGLILKDGGALERLKDVTAAAFDKTGTLTTPALDPEADIPAAALAAAAALARHSTHPVARAVREAAVHRGLSLPSVAAVAEERGRGVRGTIDGAPVYLGASGGGEGLVFQRGNDAPVALPVVERLREGAQALVAELRAAGIAVSILSGDSADRVSAVAETLGVQDWTAGMSAEAKLTCLTRRSAAGERVLMVGDGLNDGPALAAAYASIAPADASDLSRTAADVVMTGGNLAEAWEAIATARRAHRFILQNFAIAAGYNAVAIPLAVLGLASPLVAAVAMSTSSILVTLNALRLTPRPARTVPPRQTAPSASIPVAA